MNLYVVLRVSLGCVVEVEGTISHGKALETLQNLQGSRPRGMRTPPPQAHLLGLLWRLHEVNGPKHLAGLAYLIGII